MRAVFVLTLRELQEQQEQQEQLHILSLTLREVQALLPMNLLLATQVFGKEVCCALI